MFGSKSKNLVFDERKLKKQRKKPIESTPLFAANEEKTISPDEVLERLSTDEPEKATKKRTFPKRPPKEGKPLRLPFLRNKKAMGLVLIALSLLITLGVNPALSYLTAPQMATAVVANIDIDVGDAITKEMLTEVTQNAEAILPIQMLSSSSVIGKYAASKIVAGELISQPKLTEALPFSNAYLHLLPTGKKAMSVSVTKLSASISGKLSPGDIVSVYVALPGDIKEIRALAEQPPELTYVEVLSSTNVDGIDVTAPPEESQIDNPLPITVTLAVDDAQAVILAGCEIRGGVHLALVTRGDENAANELLLAQESYNRTIIGEKKDGAANEK
ncbi:MAG: Flp pilus assembly protein CpaB [Angelakisella sp.]